MSSLGEVIGVITKAISDHGYTPLSKCITYLSASVAIGGGTVQAIEKIAKNPVTEECAKYAPDWLVWAPAIAALSLVLKNTSDWYYTRAGFKLKAETLARDKEDKK